MTSRIRKIKRQVERDGIPLHKEFKPKTKNQSEYVRSISENDITLCCGPAGSGKTAVPIGLACSWLSEGRIDKIVVTRPVVDAGQGLGSLPGELHDKIHPYLIPALEELEYYLGVNEVKIYIHKRIIQLEPLEYMRGRNFHNSFMILDEAQNCTKKQIKMFLTRIGQNSKCVLDGDMDQTDLRDSGLSESIDKLENVDGVGIVELTTQDILRNDIISRVLTALG